MIRALLLILLFCVSLDTVSNAVEPKAVITGPRESRTGALVVLSATESQGLGRKWLLAVSPQSGASFAAFDNGLTCVFADPVPGTYVFVLVVSGVNPNGGAMADMATHAVELIDPSPPPPPTPPPAPVPPPGPEPTQGPKEIVILRESSEVAARESALILELMTDQGLRETLTQGEHRLTVFDPDQTSQDGVVQGAIQRLRAERNQLPSLFVVDGSVVSGPILYSGPLPGTVAEVAEVLRGAGG